MTGRTAFSGSRLDAPAAMLGEGPTYDPHTGTAWWFDIVGKKLFEYALETHAVKIHDLPVMGSMLARVDGEYTFRQLAREVDRWALRALNPSYPSVVIDDLSVVAGVIIQKSKPGRRRASKRYVE